MYYILYGILYFFSLLPFPVIYFIGDGIYVLVYYVFGYRKKVVVHNLQIAFPEKTQKERTRIAKDFYHGLIDTFMETIKMLSMQRRTFNKYVDGNVEIINEFVKKGKSIQFLTGHHFNWEYANWYTASNISIPFWGVYMPLANKALNKIFFDLRKKQGTHLISATDFKNKKNEILQGQYGFALVADQNPGSPQYAHWLNFFDRPTAFITGPIKGAVKNNTAVVFARFTKEKRGHYYFYFELITENAAECTEKELVIKYRNFIEQSITMQPANYLWSHRRWKWDYKTEYESQWVEDG